MKNKRTTTYFLVISVAVVWGMIVKKILKNVSEPAVNVPSVHIAQPKSNAITPEDSITLSAAYRDPFLDYKVPANLLEKQEKPGDVAPVKIPVQWPKIEYEGVIYRKNSPGKLFLLKIENAEFIVKEKEHFYQQLTLLKGNKDSLFIENKDERLWFKKE